MPTATETVTVEIGFVSGRVVTVVGVVTREDVDRWLATKIVSYGDVFHPMTAVETIVILKDAG